MRKFVIVSDSCCDLDKAEREKYSIEYIPMHFIFDENEYSADLDWGEFSVKEFYDLMRGGKRIRTAQVNAAEYKAAFEKYIDEGCDILSISCSSALSASVKASYLVRDELAAKYLEAKIICIDSLNSCHGLGLICIKAAELREEGKSIEEVAEWVEEHKLEMNQEAVADSLVYLKRAGRVSAAKAFFGGLLSVKPIIISAKDGNNLAVEKVKGRAASITRLAERVAERYKASSYQKLCFVHADDEEGVAALRAAVLERIPDKDVEIVTGYIGPIIGASVGPGTVAVYFWGKKVED